MEPNIEKLTETGAVGISIALIYLIYKIYERCSKNSEKIIEVVQKNAEVIGKLTGSIDANTTVTKKIGEGWNQMNEIAREAMHLKRKKI